MGKFLVIVPTYTGTAGAVKHLIIILYPLSPPTIIQ